MRIGVAEEEGFEHPSRIEQKRQLHEPGNIGLSSFRTIGKSQ
jgi:hypothetical protein